MGGPGVGFRSTLWTVIQQAREGSREAYDRLIAAYWKPVYAFIRRRGRDIEQAKDLTQGFFTTFLEKDFLKDVAPERGKFRSFVMASLSHFLSNEYDRSRAQKRGGHLNFVEVEADLSSEDPSPERAFDRQWALEILRRAMDRLRSEVPAEDMDLLAGASPPGLSPAERKYRLRRLRQRLRECLREEILPSVVAETEAEAEIDDLFAALG